MRFKVLEIRDRMTSIPWLACRLVPRNDAARSLLRRVGYATPEEYVIQGPANGGAPISYDVFKCAPNERTRLAALLIAERFDELEDGAVIDVRVILGEEVKP